MKKLMFVLAILTSMFFVSCEKDILDFDLTCEVKVDSVSVFGASDGKITVKVLTGNNGYNLSYTSDKKSSTNVIKDGNTFTVTSLSAGNYTVTVTDAASKSFTKSVSVYEPGEVIIYDELKATIKVTHNELNNGEDKVEINATGGKKPYTFNIMRNSTYLTIFDTDSVFNSVGGGTYRAVVKDNRGVEFVSDEFVVYAPFNINVDVVDADNSSDNNGKIKIYNIFNTDNVLIKINDGVWTSYTFVSGWVTIDNINVGNYTISAKDGYNRVRAKDVTVGTTYNKLRIGDEYNKNGDVGRVFFVDEINNKALIAWNVDEVSAKWGDSQLSCRSKGSGWDMPTLLQLGYLMEAFKNDNRFSITRNVDYWSLNRDNGTSNIQIKKIDSNNVISGGTLNGNSLTVTRAIKEVVNEK